MSEISAEIPVEQPRSNKPERPSVKEKIGHIGKRLLQFVKPNYNLPEQAFSPTGQVEAERKTNPTRAEKMSDAGCAVRSIMSAAAFATGEKDLNATGDEWDTRFKQIDDFDTNKPIGFSNQIEKIEQDLIDLYAEYAQNDTKLGRALQNVNIERHKEQSVDDIKNDIKTNKQVLVYMPGSKPPHIFHAGLNKRGRIIALSDPKRTYDSGKEEYHKVNLFRQTYTTFTVTPNAA